MTSLPGRPVDHAGGECRAGTGGPIPEPAGSQRASCRLPDRSYDILAVGSIFTSVTLRIHPEALRKERVVGIQQVLDPARDFLRLRVGIVAVHVLPEV